MRASRSIRRHRTTAPSAYPAPPNRPPFHTCDSVESAFNNGRDLSPDGEHRIRGAPAETVPSAHANQIPIARGNTGPVEHDAVTTANMLIHCREER